MRIDIYLFPTEPIHKRIFGKESHHELYQFKLLMSHVVPLAACDSVEKQGSDSGIQN